MLLDDYRARKVAKAEGLGILGTGLLEALYLRRYLTDLRSVLQELLTHNVTLTGGCWIVVLDLWDFPRFNFKLTARKTDYLLLPVACSCASFGKK